MTPINTEGLAFIGPGSEWFWTAISGAVLAVTFIAIYRQLRLARSASVRELSVSFDREWDSERMLRHRLAILVALRDGATDGHAQGGSSSVLVNYWEGVARLARDGDVDLRALYVNYGTVCQAWWAILEPGVRSWRVNQGDSTDGESFEWLAGVMRDLDRRADSPAFDPASVVAGLEVRIADLRERIRVEEALRTFLIA